MDLSKNRTKIQICNKKLAFCSLYNWSHSGFIFAQYINIYKIYIYIRCQFPNIAVVFAKTTQLYSLLHSTRLDDRSKFGWFNNNNNNNNIIIKKVERKIFNYGGTFCGSEIYNKSPSSNSISPHLHRLKREQAISSTHHTSHNGICTTSTRIDKRQITIQSTI